MTTIAPTVEEAATGHGYISDKNRYLARLKRCLLYTSDAADE